MSYHPAAAINAADSRGAGPPVRYPRSPLQCATDRDNGQPQNFVWSKVCVHPQSAVPPPRSGAASVVVQGKLYMFGGYGGGTGRLDDFYSFDFATSTWEQVQVKSDVKPGCRENNGVVISDSSRSIYLFGGYNGNSWLNDLWKYDIESMEWSCIQESSDPSSVSQPSASIEPSANINDAAGTSLSVKDRVPSRRFGYVSVVHNNKLVLFGGFDGNRWCNDMYVFDFDEKRWSEIYAKGELPSVRSCPAWATDETHVYIQGGYDGVERKDDFFACDLNTYTWKQMPNLGTVPSPRYFHSCSLYGSKMYLYGGYSGCQRLDDMFAYDFETNHWSEIANDAGDAPSGRSSLVAQIYGNSLYVFGGYNGETVLNDFYKFRLKPIGVPSSALVSDFQRLLNQPDMSDVVFIVEGQEVHAHKAILAIRSEYFRILLFNGMRESLQSSQASVAAGGESSINGAGAATGAIDIQDVSHEVFLKVLEFIYTDNIQNVSMELGIHLLIASEHFLLDRLKSLCEDVIRREINPDNVIGILLASHQHNAVGLKDIALEYILKNLRDHTVNSGLDELKAEPDLLVEIIRLKTIQLDLPRVDGQPTEMATQHRRLQQQERQQQQQRQLSNGPFGAAAEWRADR
mmetsp:Transcript_11532/g.33145  ORF Transcript_11532/g.33145 Transcript_11532/m.33145 type:complete len:629 (-) Transcript_11532:81-1967(-)